MHRAFRLPLRRALAAVVVLGLALGVTVAIAAATPARATECDRFSPYDGSLLGNYPGNNSDGHSWNHCDGWYSQGSTFTVNEQWSFATAKVFTHNGVTYCVQVQTQFQMDTYNHGANLDFEARRVTYANGACTNTGYSGGPAISLLVAGQIQQASTADNYSTVSSTSNYIVAGRTLGAGVQYDGWTETSSASSATWAETGWGTAIGAFYRTAVLVDDQAGQSGGYSTWAAWVG